jgi:4-cresol dehydrogenase (hydroxylating) flavoprotein subunit
MTGALAAFAEALGPDAVLTSPDDLRAHRDPYSFAGWNEFTASAVVLPATVEQVQAIVRIANEHRVPLWTFSQGRNNAYGGPAPRVSGSVLVGLRRMDRVLELNEELAYALVEPGVRFFDLRDAVRSAGYKLWISVPDLGWGSVVGNALDHGWGFTPNGDHAASQCGMEVVLASGDVLRTGMGAMSRGRSWQVYRRGFGPSPDGLFMQSNFGIVTKMGVWLMPQPECYLSGRVRVREEADLGPLIDALRPLLLDRTIPNYPLIGGPAGANAMEVADPGRWNMRFALYGREPVVDAQLAAVRAAFSAIPGATVAATRYAGSEADGAGPAGDRVQAGVPGMDILELVRRRGGEHGGHLDFSPVCPLTGRDVLALCGLMRSLAERHGVAYSPGLIAAPRSLVHVLPMTFDTTDEAETRRAYELYELLVTEVARAGYGLYRAHLRFMDLVADQYDFNDHAQRRFNQVLKDALDPNGILSPGKQGIWPSLPLARDRATSPARGEY